MNVIKSVNNQKEVDLLAVVKLLIRKIRLVILAVIVFGAAAYGGSRLLIKPKYRSSVTFYINNIYESNGTGNITTSDISASIMLVQTYAAVITSEVVLEDIISLSGVKVEPEALERMLIMTPVNNTGVLVVSVIHTNPKAALAIASAIAEIVPSKMVSIINGSSAKVLDSPKLPTARYSPSYTKLAVLGAIAGGFISSFLIVLFYILKANRKPTGQVE